MNILIVGITGQMGQVLVKTIEDSNHTVAAGIGHSNEDHIYDNFNDVTENIDVIIDFSSPELLSSLLDFATTKKIPVVIATTGIDSMEEINKASKEIPIVYAGNYSLGINILEKLAETVSRALQNFDIEITETHHNKKKDAPSGTAHMLFDAVNNGRDNTLSANYGREGMAKRESNEVGIHALRGGTVVGTHTVSFFGEDEVLELTHTAYSKRIFAEGSLKAAEFIVTKTQGLYDVNDILEVNYNE